MAEIDLSERKTDVRREFEPVVLSDGTKVTFHKNVVNGVRNFYAEAEKNGKNVGRVSFGDDTNRLFLQVEKWDVLGENAAKEIVDTLYKGMIQLLKD